MLQRFLDPSTLAAISGLDLVAKTVVDGFVAGLLLQRLAKHLFNEEQPLEAFHYNNWKLQ